MNEQEIALIKDKIKNIFHSMGFKKVSIYTDQILYEKDTIKATLNFEDENQIMILHIYDKEIKKYYRKLMTYEFIKFASIDVIKYTISKSKEVLNAI